MINSKETLKKLHKKFPLLTLDELFDILDCYVAEYNWSTDPFSWRYKYTTGSTSNNESLNDQINKLTTTDKITTVTYGTNSTSYGSGDLQLAANH